MAEREKWSNLDIKSKIAYITAVAAFICGWGLTIAGFCVPPIGMVTDSILWILGQSLVYAASVFGVGLYVTSSVKGMKESLGKFMADEKKIIEEEKEEE